jgi:hypothetical protein
VALGGPAIDVTLLTPGLGNTNSFSMTYNVTYDVVDITGKGFLSQFYALDTLSYANITVDITIDGTKVYSAVGGQNSLPIGVINLSSISGKYSGLFGVRDPHSNTSLAQISDGAVSAFPYTGGSDKIMFLNQPLFFHESLLVQLMCSTSTSIGYTYEGAYM